MRPTADNGKRVLAALREFSAPVDLPPEQFESPRTMLVLGRDPFQVDMLTAIPGLEFEDCWSRRDSVLLKGTRIPLLSKSDFLSDKRASGRIQDLADVEAREPSTSSPDNTRRRSGVGIRGGLMGASGLSQK